MVQAIAIVKLAPGEVGYYDPYTKIHLTLSRQEATVYSYMNTSRLRTAIAEKILILKAGSLNSVNYSVQAEDNATRKAQSTLLNTSMITNTEINTAKTEAIIEKDAVKEIPVVEEPTADDKTVTEEEKKEVEEVVEKIKKRRTTKKDQPEAEETEPVKDSEEK